MSTIAYFAYGSNMSTARIRRRVGSATVVSRALLPEHRLQFHKKGADGSAKCDIEHTHSPHDIVHGVVFQVHERDMQLLDRYEGLGNGYEKKPVTIHLPDGSTRTATTYYATHIDASLQPYHWYREHVLRGAREHGLPHEHIAVIEAVASIADPDERKHIEELSIYSEVSTAS